MNPKVKKLVFVIQDLRTKDGEDVAILSGDIHFKTIMDKTDPPVSFQMLLADNKEFARNIKDLVAEALSLKAQQNNKKHGLTKETKTTSRKSK